MMPSADPTFQIGQRIRSSDAGAFKGTIRYIGPVAGQQGKWIGIEWDESERGKHDGETGGVKYFTVKQAGAGSFVRSHKIEAGVAFVQALKARYKPEGDLQQVEGSDEMYIMSVRNRPMPVVFVGLDKIQQKQGRLEHLQQVALIDAGIDSAGQPGTISAIAKNIEELDLSSNLLQSWSVVGQIYSELPKLKILNVSKNLLEALPDSPAGLSCAPVFTGLTTLVLNCCAISWATVTALKPSLPAIEELRLCGNGIENFGTHVIDDLPSLRLLDLEDNKISQWDDVLKLSSLRSLTSLLLSGNLLTKVRYPQAADRETSSSEGLPFAGLRCLLLGRNQLSEWTSVDALDRFPSLQEVRLTDNPLTDSRGGTAARYMLIARIGRLTSLNGSNVSFRERRDSEVRYVRHVITQQLEGKEDSVHPRFEGLKAQYGLATEDLVGGAAVQKSMADELCSLSLTCVAPGAGERAPVVKKLPASTTVARLRVFCEKLFRVKADRQRLFFTTEDSPHPTSIDSDEDTLGNLGFGSSATILIDEVDAAILQQEQAVAQMDHERRLQQQLKQVELFTNLQKAEVEEGKRTIAGRR